MGLVHIYCGDGKGKTSAAVGLAVRAAGRGLPVVIARFLKTDDSGEVDMLKRLPGVRVLPCERTFGFVFRMSEETKREAAVWYGELFSRAVREAKAAVRDAGGCGEPKQSAAPGEETADRDTGGCGKSDPSSVRALLVLDEIMAAVNYHMVSEDEVLHFLNNRPEGLEVVLTGRDPSKRMLLTADYVSEIGKTAHPFDRGIGAREGIEY